MIDKGDLEASGGVEGLVEVDVEERGIWGREVCVGNEVEEVGIVGEG